MNCFIWILLLLGCCGNSGNSYNVDNCGCNRRDTYNYWNNSCDRCGCDDRDCDSYEYSEQSRMNNDCECNNYNDYESRSNNRNISYGNSRYMQNDNYIAPPAVPNRVAEAEDCGCNN